jgi:electron transport complex protein RnfD|tara:strand:- start:12420 stop:13316 length:897 start_codon:yes stop_codon:yes gene_type:complete
VKHGPFIHGGGTIRKMMLQAVAALLPVCAAALWRYGMDALWILSAAIASAWLVDYWLDRENAFDGSAIMIGCLCGLLMPATAPFWLGACAGALGVGLGKQCFGGLGQNLFNPAALSRVILMSVLPVYFFMPRWPMDGTTQATPLAKELASEMPTLDVLFSGGYTGTLGESMPLALIAGALMLLYWRLIDWRVPLYFFSGIAFLALILPASARMEGHAPWLAGHPLAHLFGGGTLLAGIFMLTDPVTSPMTSRGRIIFSLLAALYTMLVRYYTIYSDGVILAVLFANASVPLIDRVRSR